MINFLNRLSQTLGNPIKNTAFHVRNQEMVMLNIPPIGELNNERMILYGHIRRKIVICVYNEQIRRRPVSPLKARVQVHIILLFVILQKGGPENFIGKRNIEPRAHEPKSISAPGVRKTNVIVTGT